MLTLGEIGKGTWDLSQLLLTGMHINLQLPQNLKKKHFNFRKIDCWVLYEKQKIKWFWNYNVVHSQVMFSGRNCHRNFTFYLELKKNISVSSPGKKKINKSSNNK